MAGAPLMPISQTLLLRISPPEKQNMALGLWSMTTLGAPVAGPWLGGIIADSIGWRWVFYLNIPVAIICALLAWRTLRSRETETVRNPIDFVGLILLIVWVSALQVVLDNGQKYDWFGSSFITTAAVIAAVAFLAFIAWEITDAHPIVDIRIFRYRTFTVSVVTMFFHRRRIRKRPSHHSFVAPNQHGIHRDCRRRNGGFHRRSRCRGRADSSGADAAC